MLPFADTQYLIADMNGTANVLDGYLTPIELTQQLGVTTRTLQRREVEPSEPTRTVFNRKIFYRVTTVLRWLESKEFCGKRLSALPLVPNDRRHLYESIDEGRRSDDGEYVSRDFADWREIPSKAWEQKELRQAMVKALDQLPEKYRSVLILRDVQHPSIAETAQALSISEPNVKTRLARARFQMRDALVSADCHRTSL